MSPSLIGSHQETDGAETGIFQNEPTFAFKIPTSRNFAGPPATAHSAFFSAGSILQNHSSTMAEGTPGLTPSVANDVDITMNSDYYEDSDPDKCKSRARSRSILVTRENYDDGSPIAMNNGFDNRPPPRRGAPSAKLTLTDKTSEVRRSQRAAVAKQLTEDIS
jgi:hypothetical protein